MVRLVRSPATSRRFRRRQAWKVQSGSWWIDMIRRTFVLSALLLLPAACSQVPQEAYFNRGSPESLLDMSSEMVSISLSDPTSSDELVNWINREQPSRAELACDNSDF